MIISFADSQGAFERVFGADNVANINIGGVIPVGDGYADGPSISTARVVGVNNFRVFALGNGPDTRPTPPATSPIVTASTLRLDMQIDFLDLRWDHRGRRRNGVRDIRWQSVPSRD